MSYPKQNLDRYTNLGGVNLKKSKYLTDLTEFLYLSNVDFETPGALSKRPGSTQAVGANTSGPITGLHEFKRNDGFSQILATAQTGLFELTGASFNPLVPALGSTTKYDFVSYQDNTWATNGETIFVYSGNTATAFGLDFIGGFNGIEWNVIGASGVSSGFTATVRYALSYINTRGYIAPIYGKPLSDFNAYPNFYEQAQPTNGGLSAAVIGISQANISAWANSGVTAIALFKSIDSFSGFAYWNSAEVGDFYLHAILPLGATRFTDSNIAFVSLGNTTASTYQFRGNVLINGQTTPANFTAIPRYLETFNNSMFLIGFSAAPSECVFSDLLQPEKIDADFNFQVKASDGDRLTGGKAYNDELLLFKQNSFHRLIGDAPENYELREVSRDYGCLSNSSIIEYKSKLLWLDKRGIVEYNGASWDTISDKIEPIFRRMNLDAVENATAVHYRLRNQVWFGIPIDGSTQNNFTVVFDYDIGAWTFFEGFNPAVFTEAKGGLALDTVWRGDYSGMIYYHGTSFYGDNGSGISCQIKPEFVAPDGHNVESMFRRLYTDVDPDTSGVTGAININMYKNYDATTIVATNVVYQSTFQTRVEMGIQARSFSFQLDHFSASLPLTVNGFGLQRRFLRNV